LPPYVDQNDPPMMLLHGQADTLVPHGQSVDLFDAIAARCGNTQFFSVPGAGHSTSDVLSSSHFGSQPSAPPPAANRPPASAPNPAGP